MALALAGLALLLPPLEALGAAIAYAVCMCGLYGGFGWLAYRELLRLRAGQA